MIGIAGVLWAAVASGGASAAPPVPEDAHPEDARPLEIYDVRLAVDIPVTLAAAGTGFARVIFAKQLARISCPCDPSQVNALDRPAIGYHNHVAATASDWTTWGLIGLMPIADLTDLGFSRAMGEDFLVYAETLTVDTAIQNIVNFATARPRPLAYANDPKYLTSTEGYLSFYAGHVTTAFAAMSAASFTLGRRHGQRVWPWIVTAVVAGSVAVERVASGFHFPTDVMVAAVAGTGFGIGIPWLHLRARQAGLAFALAPGPGGRGLSLATRF